MPSSNSRGVEHYITLFDSNYLPMGLCLHGSLMRHAGPFVLWVLCMDELVAQQLVRLDLPNVRLIPLAEAETDALRAVKASRTRGEYCWTVTPFTADMVFARDASATRATYIDADLFFYASPAPLFAELDATGKDVLITEHAFAPRYRSAAANGRFCVQFMPFRRTEAAARVSSWWQARCIEWCYARIEEGRCGDQKYLDVWPQMFGDAVHVLSNHDLALGPWNAEYRFALAGRPIVPVFYHFHGLRIVATHRMRLFTGYRIGAARGLYGIYLAAMRTAVATLGEAGIEVPVLPEAPEPQGGLRRLARRVAGQLQYASI